MTFQNNFEFAQTLDQNDPLKSHRNKFHIPQKNGKDVIYFCGNSLGLQPKSTGAYLEFEMNRWKTLGVEGHFRGEIPWVKYHEQFKGPLSRIVGAKESEVVCMNNLTTNLHLLLASFYQPKGKRVKILIEKGAFPSDHYAAESFMRMKGIDPEQHLVCIQPKKGFNFTTEEIVDAIETVGDELALVLLPGIQYYSGQLFEFKPLVDTAHKVGAYIGLDLAHAAGNVPLNLHTDKVDFATWCSYKYMNSGPGGVSGAFIHEKHSSDPDFPKLTGWWGHALSSRFMMNNQFEPAAGADAWMLSNSNILTMAAHLSSLEIFEETNMLALREKSQLLTGFLEFLLLSDSAISSRLTIITPSNSEARGCQLSIFIHQNGKKIFDGLIENNVVLDWREPNVIRVAPTPLYNNFSEVFAFCEILKKELKKSD